MFKNSSFVGVSEKWVAFQWVMGLALLRELGWLVL
jgi:hypothetical protein